MVAGRRDLDETIKVCDTLVGLGSAESRRKMAAWLGAEGSGC